MSECGAVYAKDAVPYLLIIARRLSTTRRSNPRTTVLGWRGAHSPVGRAGIPVRDIWTGGIVVATADDVRVFDVVLQSRGDVSMVGRGYALIVPSDESSVP